MQVIHAEGEYDVNNGLSPCAMHPAMQCILVSSRRGDAGRGTGRKKTNKEWQETPKRGKGQAASIARPVWGCKETDRSILFILIIYTVIVATH